MILISTRFQKQQSRLFFMLLVLLMLGTALIACSGGGSSDSGGSSAAASYTGNTSAATLTSDNSGTLVADSLQGAMTSDSMVPFTISAVESQSGGQASSAPLPVMLQAAFSDSLTKMVDAPSSPFSSQRTAMATASEIIYGSCGGSATFSASYNESSGAFSGSLSYSGYCDGNTNLSGSVTMSGRIDTETSSLDYFTFTFTSLSVTADSQSLAVTGTLDCDIQGSDTTITVDMVVAQSSSDTTCWLNNYTVQVSGSQMWISGRYYDPVHGYIDFTTEEALYFSGGDYPYTGVIVFTGATGTLGQPTQARLEALSYTECQVTADLDGNGTFEYDSGVILWTEL